MDLPIEILYRLDISNLLAIAAMGYFLNSRMNEKIDKLNNKIDKIEEKLSIKIDKLDEKLTDIDRRLCRLEGAFASKDCCMIKDSSQMKKVE